jgi:hypothetical protein
MKHVSCVTKARSSAAKPALAAKAGPLTYWNLPTGFFGINELGDWGLWFDGVVQGFGALGQILPTGVGKSVN